VLVPGLNIIIPFIDRVAYVHSLKEVTPFQHLKCQSWIVMDGTSKTLINISFG
jgi:hypothetical protein